MKPSYEIYKVRDPNMKGHIILAVDDPHSYQDILNMPDPINASFGIQIFNYTAVTLWFRAQGSGSEDGGTKWTWGSAQSLGSIGAGANAYFALLNLGSRVKPASAVDDNVVITIRAYTDAGYSNEVGDGYQILITYHWIKSDDLTLLDLDAFDTDASLEGWSLVHETGNLAPNPTLALNTSYVLSSPNAAMLNQYFDGSTYTSSRTLRSRIEKAFTVPACTRAYIIANAKFWGYISPATSGPWVRWTRYEVVVGTESCIIQGILASASAASGVLNLYTNWQRAVCLVPVNATTTILVRIEYQGGTTGGSAQNTYQSRTWFDDLKVVYEP